MTTGQLRDRYVVVNDEGEEIQVISGFEQLRFKKDMWSEDYKYPFYVGLISDSEFSNGEGFPYEWKEISLSDLLSMGSVEELKEVELPEFLYLQNGEIHIELGRDEIITDQFNEWLKNNGLKLKG